MLAGGCFWCTEAVFKELKGVEKVVSGYAGGNTDNPTYEEVSYGNTGYAETIQIDFDPKVISFEQLLQVFFYVHDPTTLNRQGNDVGEQYRSEIFYLNDGQEKIAQDTIQNFAPTLWKDPIVTKLSKLDKFWPAEASHQDYFKNNPNQAYCQLIINPKLEKFHAKFKALLK